ncbi:MAG: MMPL family transporter, partial [Actinomycetota bacterium]|nr:MMPL family transporter [Actinomycetota bacterium]
MLGRLGRWCHNRRGIVVLAWLGALLLFGGISGATGSGFSTAFSLPDVESSRGFDIIEEHFGGRGGGSGGTVVFRSEAGIEDPAVRAAMTAFLADIDAIEPLQVISPYEPDGAQQVARQGAQAGQIAYAQIEIPSDFSIEESAAVTKDVKAIEPDIDGLQV